MNSPDSHENYHRLTRWIRRGLFWGLLAAILYVTLMPTPPADPTGAGDKVEHGVAFAGLTLAFAFAYPKLRWWQLGLLMLAVGAGVELLQGAMGVGRTADWYDLQADAVGVAAVLLLLPPMRHIYWWLHEMLRLPN